MKKLAALVVLFFTGLSIALTPEKSDIKSQMEEIAPIAQQWCNELAEIGGVEQRIVIEDLKNRTHCVTAYLYDQQQPSKRIRKFLDFFNQNHDGGLACYKLLSTPLCNYTNPNLKTIIEKYDNEFEAYRKNKLTTDTRNRYYSLELAQLHLTFTQEFIHHAEKMMEEKRLNSIR